MGLRRAGPNFTKLDPTQPEVPVIIAAMLAAREAVERRSFASPIEPTDDRWWADVLADPSRTDTPALTRQEKARKGARLLHACR
jgi:hypothetical protein